MSRYGKYFALSPFRRLVVDLMHFCQKVPAVTVERTMDMNRLIEARQACRARPSWCAIFIKAMAIMSMRRPELRRAFLPLPWPRLYEHPCNVANFTIERRFQDEEIVFYAQVRRPERKSIQDLDAFLRLCQEEAVENLKGFRRALRLSRVPWPWRRLVWWLSLNLLGKIRSHNFGTFTVTTVGAQGGGFLHITPLLTSTLHYGLFDERGRLDMRLTFDHRALDGGNAARAMVELESVLNNEILDELRCLTPAAAA